jgi:hypothetical protein
LINNPFPAPGIADSVRRGRPAVESAPGVPRTRPIAPRDQGSKRKVAISKLGCRFGHPVVQDPRTGGGRSHPGHHRHVAGPVRRTPGITGPAEARGVPITPGVLLPYMVVGTSAEPHRAPLSAYNALNERACGMNVLRAV